jgi:hypothetical protein
MIDRSFYTFAEAVEKLGTDRDTLQQAIALGRVSIFFRFAGRDAVEDDHSLPETRTDPYGQWDHRKEHTDYDGNPIIFRCLYGWFRLMERTARFVGLSGTVPLTLYVTPSFNSAEWNFGDLFFKVEGYSEYTIDSTWLLASEVDSIANVKQMATPTKWPWGEHETKLLTDLAAAAREWWSTYDPEQPATAPRNEDVEAWLMSERGVSDRLAKAMATILRADGVKTGPR